ncbi:hypothetical protein ACF9IK_00930 [Kitasatospora hibisci]|uniref:hypothetical protein n=1 Tax=Kitasatospora hibisci TaxID=3369522 RepID=UPI00375441B3
MDIIVVLELDTPTNVRVLQPDRTPAEPAKAVRRAHTAPAEASGVCGPLTLCGLDTSEMTLAPHLSAHDRPRWHTCSTCRTTGGSGAGSPEGATGEGAVPGAPAPDARPAQAPAP